MTGTPGSVPERLPFATVLEEELETIWGHKPTSATLPKELIDRYDAAAPREAALNAIIHHRSGEPLSAICLSGGGIRSATFSLGVLEGLARNRLLDKFSFLSTVSGGGYIGSWLTAWIHRKAREFQKNEQPDSEDRPINDEHVRRAIDRISDELAGRNLGPVDSPASDFAIGSGKQGVAAEAAPVVQLRRFSNYLAPEVGLLSADSWVLIATVLRNIILNWLVLIPVLMGALTLPRLLASAVYVTPLPDAPWADTLRHGIAGTGLHLDGAGWLLVGIGFITCSWTIGYVSWKRVLKLQRPSNEAKTAINTSGARAPSERAKQKEILQRAVLPLFAAAIALSIGWAWLHLRQGEDDSLNLDMWKTIGFGAGVMLAGWLGYFFYSLRHSGDVDPEAVPGGIPSYLLEFGTFILCGAVGGFLLRLAAHPFDGYQISTRPLDAVVYATVAPAIFVLSFLLAATIFVGISSHRMSEMDREWWSRFGAWAMIMATGWVAVSVVTLLAPQWIAGVVLAPIAAALTAGSGAFTIFAALSKSPVVKAVSTTLTGSQAPKEGAASRKQWWMPLLIKIALPTFVVLFTIALSLLTDLLIGVTYARKGLTLSELVREYLYRDGHLQLVLARISLPWAVALILFGWGMSIGVSVNKFSLHAMYRNRLIRAYLGASRGRARTPDLFIGFDPKDDLPLCATKSAHDSKGRPLLHVVNMALNLVAGGELAWQERKAESMTATALHAGTPRLGYRRAYEYGGRSGTRHDEEGHALTLGTAMAISGAAASPNMGYHSSPMLTFLMTLFNARLGWWLGNPGPAGNETCSLESPTSSLWPLFAEAFGQTDEAHPYVYLSDGGHFENLGLYEMVRRRCRFILVVDAGADPSCEFEDLSAAVRKVRSDLGIPIDVPETSKRFIFSRTVERGKDARGGMVMSGTIRYSAVDALVDYPDEPLTPKRQAQYDGYLLYIKPAYYGNLEPIDIVHYADGHASFPHETTADQFFSESQFESYRALGMLAVNQICGSLDMEQHENVLAGFKSSIDEDLRRHVQARTEAV